MASHKIAVIPGDGIGPEVVAEGRKVVDAVAGRTGLSIEWEEFPFGADHYLKTGEVLSDSSLGSLSKFKAVYLGAIGDPRVKTGVLERGLLLRMRFGLDMFINYRPVKLYPGVQCPLVGKRPEDIDIICVRENTEDLYIGIGNVFKQAEPKRRVDFSAVFKEKDPEYETRIGMQIERASTTDDLAANVGVVTRKGSRRIIEYAFELAKRRSKKRLTCVTKSNAIEMYRFWDTVFEEVGKAYPGVEQEKNYVDAVTQWFVRTPEHYDVMVLPNMFGDIITDLGAAIQGGMGLAASGNINPAGTSMFEPIHGSAPKYKGQNRVNPIAAISAASLMLGHLGAARESKAIEDAVAAVLAEGKVRTYDLGGQSSTSEVGDAIAVRAAELAGA